MESDLRGVEIGRDGNEIRQESRRLVLRARTAIAQARTARARAAPDRHARRNQLLAMKAREIAQIERAIQFYADTATQRREQGQAAIADGLEAKAGNERNRLALAIAEREAWPPIG